MTLAEQIVELVEAQAPGWSACATDTGGMIAVTVAAPATVPTASGWDHRNKHLAHCAILQLVRNSAQCTHPPSVVFV